MHVNGHSKKCGYNDLIILSDHPGLNNIWVWLRVGINTQYGYYDANSAKEFQRNNIIYSETILELAHNLCVQSADLFHIKPCNVHGYRCPSMLWFKLAKISGRLMISFFLSKREQYSILIEENFHLKTRGSLSMILFV